MQKQHFIETCNRLAGNGSHFLFVIDFEMEEFQIMSPQEAAERAIFYAVRGKSNYTGEVAPVPGKIHFAASSMPFEKYRTAFDLVQRNIAQGNSFLLNLTFSTEVETNLSLLQLFHYSKALFKLYYQNQFVVFSPETFIRTESDCIFSYPMKGTIDASIPGAEKLLMENEKEIWEHNTIVDLIRNDLSMVSKEVAVARFRYIERIKTHSRDLLQVSSEISGKLPAGWRGNLGNILVTLLPAGSISGAPKKRTLEIISQAEGEKRGFFTGIFGIFDGENLDSGVMIRYLERAGNGLRFRSGGGITGQSDAASEFKEMIEKVYVPIV